MDCVYVLIDMDARVHALWWQMNKGLANKCVKPVVKKLTSSSTMNTSSHKLNDVRIISYSD